MDENDLPSNGELAKRVLYMIAFIAIVVCVWCAVRYGGVALTILAGGISLLLICLFIRLCIDVHSIAKNIEKKNK